MEYREKDRLENMSKLYDKISKIDPEEKGMLSFDIVLPYSSGKKPTSTKWLENSLGPRTKSD